MHRAPPGTYEAVAERHRPWRVQSPLNCGRCLPRLQQYCGTWHASSRTAGRLCGLLAARLCLPRGIEQPGEAVGGSGQTTKFCHLILSQAAIALELAFGEPLVRGRFMRKLWMRGAIGAHVCGHIVEIGRLYVKQRSRRTALGIYDRRHRESECGWVGLAARANP